MNIEDLKDIRTYAEIMGIEFIDFYRRYAAHKSSMLPVAACAKAYAHLNEKDLIDPLIEFKGARPFTTDLNNGCPNREMQFNISLISDFDYDNEINDIMEDEDCTREQAKILFDEYHENVHFRSGRIIIE